MIQKRGIFFGILISAIICLTFGVSAMDIRVSDNDAFSYITSNANLTLSTYNQTWLDFDGASTYVNIDSVALQIGLNDSGSVSAWIKREFDDTIGNDVYIWGVSRGNNNLGRVMLVYESSDDTWQILFRGNADPANIIASVSAGNISKGEWHHIVGTWIVNGTRNVSQLFIDGQFQANATLGYPINHSAGLSTSNIGATPQTDNQFFNGSIDEVTVFNYELSSEEISAIYNEGRAGVELSNSIYDKANFSAKFEDGIIDNKQSTTCTNYGAVLTDGVIGKAYNFTAGSTNRIECLHTTDLQFENKDFTVSFWIYPLQIAEDNSEGNLLPRIFRKGAYFALMFNTTNRYLQIAYEVKNESSSDQLEYWTAKTGYGWTAVLNEWNFVTFRFNATSLNATYNLYNSNGLNQFPAGRLGYPETIGFVPRIDTSDILIGNGGGTNNRGFNGTIDEVYLFNNQILSDDEVNALYLQGKQNLAGKYDFNENEGTVVYDSSVNSRNGSAIGTLSWANDAIAISSFFGHPFLNLFNNILNYPLELPHKYLISSTPSTNNFIYLNNTDSIKSYVVRITNKTNALIYNTNNSIYGNSDISLNDGNINITLPPLNASHVLDNYSCSEMIQGTTGHPCGREHSPIEITSSTNKKIKIASTLTDEVTVPVVLTLNGAWGDDCKNVNKITYTKSGGTPVEYTGESARTVCKSLTTSGYPLPLAYSTSSNEIEFEIGTTSLATTALRILLLFLALIVLASAISFPYALSQNDFDSVDVIKFLKYAVVLLVIVILTIVLMTYIAEIM